MLAKQMNVLRLKFIAFLESRTVWQTRFLVFLAGALAALTMPPWGIFALWFPSCALWLFYLQQVNDWKKAIFIGWLWGFGFVLVGLYWIAFAFMVYPDRSGWLAPIMFFLVPALFSGYYACVAAAWKGLKFQFNIAGVLAFSCLFVISEYLRGILFTGYPWNLSAHSLFGSDVMLQFISIGGISGLSFCIIAMSSLVALILSKNIAKRSLFVAFAGALIIYMSLYAFGVFRLEKAGDEMVPDVVLRIVQPSIPQELKFRQGMLADGVQKYIDLSSQESLEEVSAVLWSEGSIPYFFSNRFYLKDELKRAVPANGYLLTGGFYGVHGYISSKAPPSHVYNSLFVVNNAGHIEDRYDKMHLLFLGEYSSFESIMPFNAESFDHVRFKRGKNKESHVIKVHGLPPFLPAICFEAIFPEEVMKNVGQEAEWILNITNDGWFGESAGPHQHLMASRLRTIELGMPMIRVANNGISAAIDGYGRIMFKTHINEVIAQDTPLPQKLVKKTIYNQFPQASIIFIILLTIGLWITNISIKRL